MLPDGARHWDIARDWSTDKPDSAWAIAILALRTDASAPLPGDEV